MVSDIVLILGDQLTPAISSLRDADPAHTVIVMAEVLEEANYAPHHKKKLVFVLSAMRHFAQEMWKAGWSVRYTRLDDPQNSHSLIGEAVRVAEGLNCARIRVTEPGEWRLLEAFRDHPRFDVVADDRFLSSNTEFSQWAEGRAKPRMEHFYRQMRRKTGLLMEPDGSPSGGRWNFDSDNRKAVAADLFLPEPWRVSPDPVTREVMEVVERRFPNNFGAVNPFNYAVTRWDAEAAARYFLDHLLPSFGDYQDAIVAGQRMLYHSVVSAYLNVGLLDPLRLCRQAEARFRDGSAPINSVEGFIRQIIGWREFVRGMYFQLGPDYAGSNVLRAERALPGFYWSAETEMDCMRDAISGTHENAYAHHIQRLMVTGNFALIAGVVPYEVHQWYLGVYVDAYEWVEAPNTIGMSQYADGGLIASKPYASSGAYINRMSDYCRTCRYEVMDREGENACPFNALYWDFMVRNDGILKGNPRLGRVYSTWARMSETARRGTLARAKKILHRLDRNQKI